MKHLTAQLTGNNYINIQADRMVLEDNLLKVFNGEELVAIADVSVVLTAHISERGEK